MTLDERERRAYADGDVKTAALIREVIAERDDVVTLEIEESYNRGFDAGYADAQEAAEG